MDKPILKKIAKEWCKGIFMANDSTSFMELEDSGLLTQKEVDYIVDESHKIAERITKEDYLSNVESIVKKYYDLD